jgi:hypothetical protein
MEQLYVLYKINFAYFQRANTKQSILNQVLNLQDSK